MDEHTVCVQHQKKQKKTSKKATLISLQIQRAKLIFNNKKMMHNTRTNVKVSREFPKTRD